MTAQISQTIARALIHTEPALSYLVHGMTQRVLLGPPPEGGTFTVGVASSVLVQTEQPPNPVYLTGAHLHALIEDPAFTGVPGMNQSVLLLSEAPASATCINGLHQNSLLLLNRPIGREQPLLLTAHNSIIIATEPAVAATRLTGIHNNALILIEPITAGYKTHPISITQRALIIDAIRPMIWASALSQSILLLEDPATPNPELIKSVSEMVVNPLSARDPLTVVTDYTSTQMSTSAAVRAEYNFPVSMSLNTGIGLLSASTRLFQTATVQSNSHLAFISMLTGKKDTSHVNPGAIQSDSKACLISALVPQIANMLNPMGIQSNSKIPLMATMTSVTHALVDPANIQSTGQVKILAQLVTTTHAYPERVTSSAMITSAALQTGRKIEPCSPELMQSESTMSFVQMGTALKAELTDPAIIRPDARVMNISQLIGDTVEYGWPMSDVNVPQMNQMIAGNINKTDPNAIDGDIRMVVAAAQLYAHKATSYGPPLEVSSAPKRNHAITHGLSKS